MSLNIVELIENNPITKLSNTYQGNLLTKIQAKFTDNEQQLFVSSFYCYLNYNQKTDFVIDLDNVWKWLGFSQKVNAKTLLEKIFIIEKDYTKSLLLQQKQSDYKPLLIAEVKQSDYKIFAPEPSGAKKDTKGGHNKETIMLTIRTFKLFCLKAGTKKAEQIHDYYINLVLINLLLKLIFNFFITREKYTYIPCYLDTLSRYSFNVLSHLLTPYGLVRTPAGAGGIP